MAEKDKKQKDCKCLMCGRVFQAADVEEAKERKEGVCLQCARREEMKREVRKLLVKMLMESLEK